jgi:RNA polymerase sigma factor (sigma-70 family)
MAEIPEPDSRHDVELVAAVDRALARLGDDTRAIVVLRYYARLTDEQAADALGIPLDTARNRVARGLERLSSDPALSAAI